MLGLGLGLGFMLGAECRRQPCARMRTTHLWSSCNTSFHCSPPFLAVPTVTWFGEDCKLPALVWMDPGCQLVSGACWSKCCISYVSFVEDFFCVINVIQPTWKFEFCFGPHCFCHDVFYCAISILYHVCFHSLLQVLWIVHWHKLMS